MDNNEIKELVLKIGRVIDQKLVLKAFDKHPILRKQLDIDHKKLRKELKVALNRANKTEEW